MEQLSTSRVARRRFGRDVQANVGGVLFLIGGFVTLGALLAPHGRHVDTRGLVLLAFALIVLGALLLALPRRVAAKAPPYFVALGVLGISAGIHLSGERLGGAPMFTELFYIWPALYVGYFFTPARAAATVAGVAASYAAVLSQLPLPLADLAPRFVLTLTSVAGTTVAMRFLRRHVDRLVQRLNEVARTDALTGLLNRRAFDELLARELRRAHRTGEPFALVLGDVDHFKLINDRHGHAAGDRALTEVAERLKEHSRAIDIVARVGGEEFALILPGTSLQGGVEAAGRLRDALKRSSGPGRLPLTMSFGVVEGPRHGPHPDDLLRNADRALYAAKAAGRDRTVTPGEMTVTAAPRSA